MLPPRRLLGAVARRYFFDLAPTRGCSKHELIDIPALQFRYNEEEEVPIMVRTLSPSIPDHISNLALCSTNSLLHKNISKYVIGQVLREIFYDVKRVGPEKDLYFADPHDYNHILKTFSKLGSLFTYQLGTCCIREQSGRVRVAVDTSVWKMIERDTSRYFGYTGLWKYVKPTGYRMYTVPRSVYVHDAFKIVKHELQLRFMTYARAESRRRFIPMWDASLLASQQRIKVAVEVNRREIGQGGIVFFMDPEEAKDRNKVFQQIQEHVNLDNGVAVLPYAGESYMLSFLVVDAKSLQRSSRT